MAAASCGNMAAVALLLQQWVAVDQRNKCVLPGRAQISPRPHTSCLNYICRHGDDAIAIASNAGHDHIAQSLTVAQLALFFALLALTLLAAGIRARTAPRVPPLRRLHRPCAILEADIECIAISCPALLYRSSRIHLLTRPHACAAAAAGIAQQRHGLADGSCLLSAKIFHRDIQSHAAGTLLQRCSRAATHVSHTWNS